MCAPTDPDQAWSPEQVHRHPSSLPVAVTDPDRSICGHYSGTTLPSLLLRNPDDLGQSRGIYYRTGYPVAGVPSSDHLARPGRPTTQTGHS